MVLLALGSLALQALLAAESRTRICLLASALGTVLALLDGTAAVLDLRRRFSARLRRVADGIVLDDVLASVLGGGAAWAGTWAGLAAMYSLPLTEEQRARLFGAGLAGMGLRRGGEGRAAAADVLLEPGGLARLLLGPGPGPGPGGEGEGEGGDEAAGEPEGALEGEQPPSPILGPSSVGTDLDLTWDDDDGSMVVEGGEEEEAPSAEGSEASSSAWPAGAPGAEGEGRRHPPPGRRRRGGDGTGAAGERGAAAAADEEEPEQEPEPERPSEAALAVLAELLSSGGLLPGRSRSGSPPQTLLLWALGGLAGRSRRGPDPATAVGAAGAAAAAALVLHLRLSPRARSALAGAAHGAAALGLAGTVLGSAALLGSGLVGGGPPPPPPGEGGGAGAGAGRRSSSSSYAAAVAAASLAGARTWLRHGDGLAVRLRRLWEDERIRRRVRGAAAVLVLMYFRRRRAARLGLGRGRP